jgi:hypothetical protein
VGHRRERGEQIWQGKRVGNSTNCDTNPNNSGGTSTSSLTPRPPSPVKHVEEALTAKREHQGVAGTSTSQPRGPWVAYSSQSRTLKPPHPTLIAFLCALALAGAARPTHHECGDVPLPAQPCGLHVQVPYADHLSELHAKGCSTGGV